MAKEPSPKTKSKPAPKPAKEVSNGSRLYVVPYLLFTVVIVAYCGFLYDENGFRQKAESFPALVLFVQLFEAVEKYFDTLTEKCAQFIDRLRGVMEEIILSGGEWVGND